MKKPFFFKKKGKLWQIPEGGQIIERLYKESNSGKSQQSDNRVTKSKSKQNITQGKGQKTGAICIKKKK